MLALSSSHRGVRLHTFEPEDRAYTSTPTKIGGHALDHVVGVTLAWSRSLNKRKTTGANRSRNSNRMQCQSERSPVASEAGEAVACSTTLEPSIGRFGGLSVAVHSPRRHLRNEPPPPPAAVFMSPPLCPALAVLPPDTLAPRNITTDADVCPWRQRRHQEFGPEWTNEHCNMAEVDPAVIAPLDGSTNVASIIAARSGASGRAAPYRDMATAATGHSGALMAILLSKLANGGLSSSDSTLDTAAAATSSPPQPAAASAAALPSRTEVLHRSVDTVARGLDSIVGVDPAVPVASGGASGGSWAWKARVDQTPQYSKLRKYDFVRELGSGSHGTIFLVRKRPAGTTAARAPSISDGALDANKHGRTSGGGGGGTRRVDGNVGSDGHSAVKGSSSSSSSSRSSRDPGGISRGSPGGLRVLKESPFLPEAVNEARLLLLAAGDSVAVADDPGSRVRTGGGFGTDAGGGGVGIGCGVTASSRGGDGARSYQRGEVVQVRTRAVQFDRWFALCVTLLSS